MLLILCFAPFMSILFPYCYSFLGNSRPLIKHILHRSVVVVVVLEKGQMAIITLCASFVLIISGGQKRFGLKKVGEWTFNENLHNQNRVFWLLDGELRLLAHVTLLSTTFENWRIEIKSELISLITERVASGSA